MWAILASTVGLIVLGIQWRRSRQPLVEFVGLGIVGFYCRLLHRWTCAVRAQIPARGPALVIANHTCSADPAFLSAGCRRPLSFLVAREYYTIPILGRLFEYLHCVATTRNGRDIAAPRSALRLLQEGRLVCLFPEGGLSHVGLRVRRRAKLGAAFMALKTGAPVIPAWIGGGPQTDETLNAWLRPSRVVVRFGRPVTLSAYIGRRIDRKLLEEVTRLLMSQIANLGGFTMPTTAAELAGKRCIPCEGGIAPLTLDQVRMLLSGVPSWKVTADKKRIRREWRIKDFVTALDFFNRIGRIAEEEDHHPDLHVAGYRNVAVEIGTHAIDGLSENDFILAAKIDLLPVELKK